VFRVIKEEIRNIKAHDPAARSAIEILFCYPGFHALVIHRVAHGAWQRGWLLLGRVLSQAGRSLTGIEIHPGARIGHRCFIDHGMGVVIGETAEVGDDVLMYHGVTLGGTSLKRGKRHPTVGSGVIIGAGAKILGAITVGVGARIGSNAVVVSDVPAGATMVGVPARVVVPRNRTDGAKFLAYGTPCGEQGDPMAQTMQALFQQVSALQHRLAVLEAQGTRDPPLAAALAADDIEVRGTTVKPC